MVYACSFVHAIVNIHERQKNAGTSIAFTFSTETYKTISSELEGEQKNLSLHPLGLKLINRFTVSRKHKWFASKRFFQLYYFTIVLKLRLALIRILALRHQ